MRVALRNCPICSQSQVDVLHSQKFALPEGHPLTAGYEVVCCANCGFIYADTDIPQEAYDRFYAQHSKYEDAKTGTGGTENPWDVQRQQETAKQISDYLKNPSFSILDVGCANGGLLKSLKDIGYTNIFGIDPSPICVANTRQLGIEACQGSLSLPFNENVFDCVILSHTLEHVQDLHGAATWIKKTIKPNGFVFVETPDASRYVDFIYAPLQDFNTEHINHFSFMSLRNLMQIHGFIFSQGGKKDLRTGADMYYPAIFGFWQKADCAPAYLVEKDEGLRSSIEEYINRSAEMMSEIDARIAELLDRSPSIIVWGTGQLTMKLLAETSLTRASIIAFVDNNPINHDKILRGRPIIGPSELSTSNAPILVATLLHEQAIAKQIREMGLKNEIYFLHGASQ